MCMCVHLDQPHNCNILSSSVSILIIVILIMDVDKRLTRIQSFQKKYIWTIANFTDFYETIDSEVYNFPFSSTEKFKLCLYPETNKEEDPWVSLGLTLSRDDFSLPHHKRVHAKIKFSVLNYLEEKVKTRELMLHKNNRVSCGNFIQRSELVSPGGFLTNECLNICCEVTTLLGYENEISEITVDDSKVSECSLIQDFSALFQNPTYADVGLHVNGKTILAHKAVLAARSPVFDASFKRDMKESNLVNIENFCYNTYESVQELLRYMYTGTANLNRPAPTSIFLAADKYGVERLKTLCETAINDSMTVENAAFYHDWANEHGADTVKKRTTDFIDVNGLNRKNRKK